ncbi:MAG TPA: alpha-galactosidase, partial [Anaerohalosphaeraceae bacterium]|nr:alpha-galactosidase [Anaerohalosphaeraceae bacterium]
LQPVSDACHKANMDFVLWFEPERVAGGTEIAKKYPQYVHGGENGGLFKLDDPAARRYLTDLLLKRIKEYGIDVYRNDFNIDPLGFWNQNDTPDRQGITEIRYVEGLYALWDELLAKNPGMLIDNCASGGRRNDVESLRRSVPLLRSDSWGEPVSQQCQTYGLMNWIPFWGTGIVYSNPAWVSYHFRSQLGVHYTNCWDLTIRDFPYDLHRKLLGQWREIAPYFMKDYYPLTLYSTNRDVWMAWQYDQPESGEGAVMAFRRENCIYEGARLKLKGLESQARYTVKILDTNESQTISGQELLEKGLYIAISEIPGSAVITYKKMN